MDCLTFTQRVVFDYEYKYLIRLVSQCVFVESTVEVFSSDSDTEYRSFCMIVWNAMLL